jgi:WD40 repeat protein
LASLSLEPRVLRPEGTYENAVMLWDIPTGELGFTLGRIPDSHAVGDLRFSPDGSVLATSGIDNTGSWLVVLWPAPRGTERGWGHYPHPR